MSTLLEGATQRLCAPLVRSRPRADPVQDEIEETPGPLEDPVDVVT